MKIGMLSRFRENDGLAIYTDYLVEQLAKKGIRVVTIGGEKSKSDYKINLQSFSLKKELEKIIEKEKIQLLHVQHIAERNYYGMHTLNINLLMALKQKVPVVVSLHELHYQAKGLREIIVRKIEGSIIKRSNAIIVHTKGQKQFLEKAYGFKDANVIHMGIPIHPMHRKKDKNILFFGMLSEHKGIEYLIRAMKYLEGFKLSIAGSVIKKSYAEKIVVEASRTKSTKIEIGWISDEKKKSLMENADIMALPYLTAPYQSGVLHDAISHGIPVVVTKTGAISEIVEEFNCGEVVEPGNPEQIAEAIKKVDRDYSKYQNAMQKYRKEASWEMSAEKHIELYERILEEKQNN